MRTVMLCLAWVMAAFTTPAAANGPPAATVSYQYYTVGDPAAPTPGRVEGGLMLMGGGEWSTEAFRWFVARAGGGHIVILRASGGGEAGEELYREIGGVTSVETLVFYDRKASSDPHVLDVLDNADGIFIAGGDQSNYINFWKDTPVEKALNAHVDRGRPIGGTSAGLAILGAAAYGAMDGGSVDSATALNDPMGLAVTMVRDFLDMPRLQHVVTDTHFAARDRLGRLIAFVAQVRATSDPQAIGLGVDEDGAVCVDANGIGRFYTASQGYAWLVQPEALPTSSAGLPLDYASVRVTGLGVDGEIDLNTMSISRPAFSTVASVEAGRLIGAPSP